MDAFSLPGGAWRRSYRGGARQSAQPAWRASLKTQPGTILQGRIGKLLAGFADLGEALDRLCEGRCEMRCDLRRDHAARVLELGDGLVVAAEQRVVADEDHLFEHLQAVFEIADGAALLVAPADR